MVPRDKLMTGHEKISLKEAYEILEQEKKGLKDIFFLGLKFHAFNKFVYQCPCLLR